MTGKTLQNLRESSKKAWSYGTLRIVNGALRLINVSNLLAADATITVSEWSDLDLEKAGKDIPKYGTISHSWSPSEQVQKISSRVKRSLFIDLGNSKYHEVSWHGLCQAAKAAQYLGCEYIWLDLACIHQDSHDDKKLQIQVMGHVYEKSVAVIVMPGGVAAAQEIEFSAPWITRAWTLQEVTLSPTNVYVLILHERWDDAYKYVVSSTGPLYDVTNVDDQIALSKLEALLSCRGAGLKIERTRKTTGKTENIPFIARCFGDDEGLIEALEGVLSGHTIAMRKSAAWRSIWLRTSTKPQDTVFSVMHLMGVSIVVDYERTRDDLVLELARRTSSFPSWLDIGTAIPFDPQFGLVPALPPFHPNETPSYNLNKRSVAVSKFVERGTYITKYDLKILTPVISSTKGDIICAEILQLHHNPASQPSVSDTHGKKYVFFAEDKAAGSHIVVLGSTELYGLAHLGLAAFQGPAVIFIGKSQAGIWERLGSRTTIPKSFTGKAKKSHLRIGGPPGAKITPCNCNSGIDHSIPSGNSITATAWSDWHMRVYFQDGQGGVREVKHDNGVWAGGNTQNILFQAKLGTPLSAISWDHGRQVSDIEVLPRRRST